MFAIIQHDEHLFVPNPHFELCVSREIPRLYKAERLNDSGSNPGWVVQRSQRGEENAIWKIRQHSTRCFDAQAGFADARRTQQGDEADILLRQVSANII